MNKNNSILKKIMLGIFGLVLIFAVGCAKKYTVTFEMNNGEAAVSKEVKEGETVSAPTQPSKADYEFVGWFNNGVEFDFNTAINEDLVLQARFQIDEALAEKYTVLFFNGEEQMYKINVLQDRTIHTFKGPTKEGHTFLYWALDGKEFDFNTQITSDLRLEAVFEADTITVTFVADGQTTTQAVKYGETLVAPATPVKEGKSFVGWYLGDEEFDMSTPIKEAITLEAKFGRAAGTEINITYDFGYECYLTKNDLREAYYTDFYNFLVTKEFNFSRWKITDLASFLEFLDTWTYDGRSEMGNIGVAFATYYLESRPDGKVEDQSTDCFIGWCWQNGKYHDLINHLIEFFAYWRTDEGYTTETNHGNDFFYDAWAAMVDTAKFFHFTSANITDTYSWFTKEKSARVHYALDNIPGVGYVTLVTTEKFNDSVTLPQDVTRKGYEFLGWFDDNDNAITVVTESMTVHAKWKEAAAQTE